jgi:hypothetical protein
MYENLHVYKARRRGQRGHGIGSILSRLFRSFIPLIKKGGRYLGRQGLRTGVVIAKDILAGATPREAFNEGGHSLKKKFKKDIDSKMTKILSGKGRSVRRRKKGLSKIKRLTKKKKSSIRSKIVIKKCKKKSKKRKSRKLSQDLF